MPKTLDILRRHKLRKTPIRQQVLAAFLATKEAMSHARLEGLLADIDRVTLYRTLRTFEENGIIHKAIDGTDVARYALCHGTCKHDHHIDNHAHFRCGKCDKTICLEGVEVPKIGLPKGLFQESAHLIIKGTCEQCNA